MSVKFPTIKINTFFGGIEEFPSFWERFNSCIDSNASLSLVDKHVFLRGYLDGEAKRLVDGISVICDTYETTKKLLEDKYGNKDRIIQSHLDYLENLKPVQDPSPMEVNDLYIECNRRLQALNTLGKNTEAYGRILAPKIIRAFPTEICCLWIIYAKREKLAEGNITRLMQFLAEEVEGSVEAQKIRDGGSQASFVDVKLIDKLKPNVINSSSLRVQAFESSFTQEQRRCVQLTLSGLWSKQSILITAFESNNSYTTHPAATLEISQFAHKNKLKLADPPDNSSLPIELLIGGDYYWQIVTAESPIKLSDSFVMVSSMLGWILSSSRTYTTITDNTFVHQFSVQVSNDCLNDQVRCLWELDSIGIQDLQKRRMNARDEEILSKFHKDYKTEDNRRIVSLTWKSIVTPLSPNIVNAKNRFHFVQKRLSSSNVLKTQYYKYEIAVYRFSRLPFGLTCSPFLLCASTRELVMKHISEFPIAASMIDKHLYMDDFLASTETETHITMLYHDIKYLMTLMKLSMEKWATNSLKLKDVIQTNKEFHKSTTAVLGIDWDTNDDTLDNAFKTPFCVAGDKPLTKRWLLRCIASCYDPLGLFSPFTIIGKILFQDTWILGIKWDELLPTNLSTMWYATVKQLDDICSIKISRYIGISSHTPYSVHVFCDASERAYGSVLCIVTSQSNIHIVCSRNRLAPIKRVTLPRLELLAALMGTRLLKYFSQWRYCPGTQNPADNLSRGILPSKLSNLKNWWYGPDWLTQEPSLWPTEDLSSYERLKTDKEARKPLTQSLYVETTNPVIDITHCSSYTKFLRVTAWILRFLHNCRNELRFQFELTAEELQKAKDYWILNVQQQCFHVEMEALKNNCPLPTTSKIARFNPFLKNNQIRLGGRLQFAPLSTDVRHPLLLEGNHPFVLLLIKSTRVRLHHLGTRIVLSELRSDFWILRGRQAIKKVLHQCLPCKLSKLKCGNQIEGPLPSERVTPSVPFSTTGLCATKWLKEAGVSVIVLEALDRVGGRTLTKRDPKVNYVDLGGSYIGPTQDHLFRLTKELGITNYKINLEQKCIYYRNGWRTCYQSTDPPNHRNPFVTMDINNIWRLIDRMGEEIPSNAPWDALHADEWDVLTLRDFLQKHCWTKEAREYFNEIIADTITSEPYEVSLLSYLWYVKQCGGTKKVMSEENGAQERKFHGGSQQICEKIAEKLGKNIVVQNSPVVAINQESKDFIIVKTISGKEFKANCVILACPPIVQMKIHFSPKLPPMRNQLIQRMPMGSVTKVILYYSTSFWRKKGFCGVSTIIGGENHPVSYSVDDTKPDGSKPAIVGFITADKCRKMAHLSPEERKNAIARSLAMAMSAPEALTVLSFDYKRLNIYSKLIFFLS
ncbi:amine oxidase [Nephila pilipes]|uniref:Amine oxidase n=1 Tax=Nephila pilipes TaxID=299642 RepID=A0A8X6TBF8_NEPPI|nr:amine oxidase [Nephila pilipes]